MAEFEGYRSELISFVKRSGKVSAQDLVKWAKEKGLTMLTLYIIVEEVLEAGELKGSGDKCVIDEIFNLEIPSTLEPAQPAAPLPLQPAPAKRPPAQSLAERRERARERRRAVVERGSLLKFFTQEQDRAEQPLESVSKERPEAEDSVAESVVQAESAEASLELASDLRELLADDDLVRAIRYLERYWSVGKLRFLEDLENLGVKDPRRVLEDLLRRGLVEVVEPGFDGAGVVNAKEELFAIAKKIVQTSSTQLSDFFRKKDLG